MRCFGRPERKRDISRLSDAELIQQQGDQAKELGVNFRLEYEFAKQSKSGDELGVSRQNAPSAWRRQGMELEAAFSQRS